MLFSCSHIFFFFVHAMKVNLTKEEESCVNRTYRLSIFFSVFLIILVSIFFRSEHLEQSEGTSSNQKAMNNLQAEDLIMTIDLFMNQVKQDLLGWEQIRKQSDNTDWIVEELNHHDHIEAFAVLDRNNKNIKEEIGDISAESLDKLPNDEQDYLDEWYTSDPYIIKGSKKMLISHQQEHELIVSEVDISFVEHFVKDFAALSDREGSFVLGNSNIDVSFASQDMQSNENIISKKVPGLDWNLYLESEPSNETRTEEKKGEVVVTLSEGVSPEQWVEDHEVVLLDQLDKTIVVRDLTKNATEMMDDWFGDSSVKYMEPNYVYEKQASYNHSPTKRGAIGQTEAMLPNDEFYDLYQWNFKMLGLENAWGSTTGAFDVPVAILDSGIDPTHLDLEQRISSGYNAFEDNDSYQDENGHGTHVAGIFGAVTNNSDGVAGVTWENPIMAVKVLDHDALGNSFSIAKGIKWATDNGAKVMNLSLGDAHSSEVLHDAIKYAYNNDVVIIAATGNENVEDAMFPAGYKEVLAVGSVNQQNERSVFSNYGNHVDVVAPGEHIPSTYMGDEYVMMSGTSMAAPHVTGIAALLRSKEPDLTNEEVYQRIRDTALDLGAVGFDRYYGYGEIDTSRLFAN